MKQYKVTLIKSTIGCLQSHKDTVRGLGLKRINSTRVVKGTDANKGMINQVRYLLSVEEI